MKHGVRKARGRRVTYSKLIEEMIRLTTPVMIWNFTRPSPFVDAWIRPYLGKAGPKTFRGTPEEVARRFRDWQRRKP